jgi:hypothetical protein
MYEKFSGLDAQVLSLLVIESLAAMTGGGTPFLPLLEQPLQLDPGALTDVQRITQLFQAIQDLDSADPKTLTKLRVLASVLDSKGYLCLEE